MHQGLLTPADAADSGLPVPEVGEAEARARLALLGQLVDRYESGEARLSELTGLLRQLTAEMRRG